MENPPLLASESGWAFVSSPHPSTYWPPRDQRVSRSAAPGENEIQALASVLIVYWTLKRDGRWGVVAGGVELWPSSGCLPHGPHDNFFHLDEPHNWWYKLQLSAMLSGKRKVQGLLQASTEISVQPYLMINGEQWLFFLLWVPLPIDCGIPLKGSAFPGVQSERVTGTCVLMATRAHDSGAQSWEVGLGIMR